MSDYTKTTDFAAKDALTTGNPSKVILGEEIDDELNDIAIAIASKLDSGGSTMTSITMAGTWVLTGTLAGSDGIIDGGTY